MREIPTIVHEALKRLREQSSESLEIRVIKGGFYVYKVKNIWNRARKKQVKKGEYFGKIESDGTFKPVQKRKPRMRIHSQESKGSAEAIEAYAPRMHASSEKYEIPILRALSMNARISMRALGELVGLSETAVKHQVANLERKYRIRYIPEIDVRKLGYLQFFVTVKFLENVPDIDKIKRELENMPHVQLAFFTKGDFDLIIYLLAKDNEEADKVTIMMRVALPYKSEWNVIALLYEDYGFIPIRDKFFEALEDKTWRRTKENPKMLYGQIAHRTFLILRELNKNIAEDFSKIANKFNLTEQDVRYEYLKLKDTGIIRRATISIDKLPIRYIGMILSNFIDYKQFRANRPLLLSDIIEDTAKPTNKYSAVYDIANPYGMIFLIPVIESEEFQKIIEKQNKLNLGERLKTLIVTDILVGNFCFRKFDNAYSVQQKILEEEYGYKKVERINYEPKEKQRVNYKLDIRGLPMEKVE